MTSSAAMNIKFLHCQNLPFLRYIHCNFCLNPHIIHGDMKENVSGCFFLNTVYNLWEQCITQCIYTVHTIMSEAASQSDCSKVENPSLQ